MVSEAQMTATDWAAWIGAFTGVGALLFQIYERWMSGPQVRMKVSPNNLVVEIGEPPDATRYIVV